MKSPTPEASAGPASQPTGPANQHLRRPTPVWPLILLAVLFAAAATGLTAYLQHRPTPLATLFPAPSFSLTNQHEQTVSSADLKGKVYVADFIFTRCGGPCPRMTETMAQLSRSIDSSRVRFVSFTVDPAHDRPAVLAEYATKFGVDPNRAMFLTSPGTDYIDIARGFKVAVEPAQGERPIIHSPFYFLVDVNGQVRGQTYDPRNPKQLEQLKTDIGRLLGE